MIQLNQNPIVKCIQCFSCFSFQRNHWLSNHYDRKKHPSRAIFQDISTFFALIYIGHKMKPITRHTIAAWNPLIQEIGIPNNAMQILLILRWDIVSYDDDLLCCCYLFGIEQQYDCKKTMCCQVSGVGRNNKVGNIVGYLWKP